MEGLDDPAPLDASRTATHHKGDNITVVIPPNSTTSSLFKSIDTLVLPQELIDILNHTYFLHILATEPTKVLPPGKSLLSVLSHAHSANGHTEGSAPSLQDRVEDMVHKAFWNEAVESLSNPEPSIQLARLKYLYNDLWTSLTPLLPAGHPVLVTLSSQLSPTSSPLFSAITHLREVLTSLRERCAPARDPYIDSLLTRLKEPPPDNPPPVALARLVVDTVKSTIDLSKAMKDDLSQFVLGSMGEKQLKVLIAQQARTQERSVLLGLWRPEDIQKSWSAWIADIHPPYGSADTSQTGRDKFISRLIQALGAMSPVMCSLPTKPIPPGDPNIQEAEPVESLNSFPPPFFFVTPSLLYIQNLLQALVITASLRSLTRLPAASVSPSTNGTGADFMQRIWALLTAEISEDTNEQDSNQSSTKLVNLADEVVRARNLAMRLESSPSPSSPGSSATSHIDAGEEKSLRSAVERTLQPLDPVFVLLQKRLLGALADRLIQPSGGAEAATIPERMQTGRYKEGERTGKRPRMMLDPEDMRRSEQEHMTEKEKSLVVKGLEDPVLVVAIGEALGKIRDCVRWVEEAWEDLVESGDGGSASG
ncbi:hypothetical protein PILCRDRAFT_80202 [Piloderma croceum F 1598]|uniref:Uncharacterized protein n=1 Tax=Piloderma croceum (strain F 1598) TaxID=765440 RepID=A0A0C3EP24_PILCF|nr:hypothetical protein PILCRDRAFT_80202 [Piloderma croceum F 1598]